MVRQTLLGAVATQLVQPGDEVVSVYHRRLEHGYPTPSLGRDGVLKQALPWLRRSNIWSRGRWVSGVVLGRRGNASLCPVGLVSGWRHPSFSVSAGLPRFWGEVSALQRVPF